MDRAEAAAGPDHGADDEGNETCSPVRYQYFVDWLTRLSIASVRKSPNMISTTGRSPETAAPNAAPASASSEIGVSKTRSRPYFL